MSVLCLIWCLGVWLYKKLCTPTLESATL